MDISLILYLSLTTITIINLLLDLFTDKIFKIIRLQKNKLDILMGNLKTTVEKKESIYLVLF